jgi:hypothetical protein
LIRRSLADEVRHNDEVAPARQRLSDFQEEARGQSHRVDLNADLFALQAFGNKHVLDVLGPRGLGGIGRHPKVVADRRKG